MLNHFELDNTFEDQSLILDIYRCGMKNELADNVSRHFSIVQYFIFVHPHSFSFSSILDFLINNFKAKLCLRDFVFREFPFRRCPNIRRSTEEEVPFKNGGHNEFSVPLWRYKSPTGTNVY